MLLFSPPEFREAIKNNNNLRPVKFTADSEPGNPIVGSLRDLGTIELIRVINNSRFSILPWVLVNNLASKVLALSAKRLLQDWQNVYGYSPVLLETFVDKERYPGTCYKAANWRYIGETKGRGKFDRCNEYGLPIKDIYLYPLSTKFHGILTGSD